MDIQLPRVEEKRINLKTPALDPRYLNRYNDRLAQDPEFIKDKSKFFGEAVEDP